MIPVITIDGPSGSGKGTISKLIAKKLGWHLLDSGALYRVLALAVIRLNIASNEVKLLQETALNLDVQFVDSKIILMSQDVTSSIRSEECGKMASVVAAQPEVRQALLDLQRNFRQRPGLVADGRDMGTVVFPDAKLKLFLTADCSERAKRRHQQLHESGINVSLRHVLQEMCLRDARDKERSVAPLKAADDAIIIDTTELSIDRVMLSVMEKVERTFGQSLGD